MRQQEKIKTSVFSEYENNQNDSLSSRQLEYWLKQTAPSLQPKFAGIEWTLMSTNSIFEQQQHTLQRNQTFQSLNKENDHLAFNSARPTLSNNSSAILKSKSYVNAMVDLQNRVKSLQQENSSLKKSMDGLKGERNKLMSESSHLTEELKQRLQILEPKTKRLDQLMRENKMLRDSREQGARKSKMLQKINRQNQSKLIEYEKQLQKLQEEMMKREQLHQQTINRMSQSTKQQEKMRDSLVRLQERNKILEDMKEKSTTTIIEKYNKSVQMVETLTAENIKLKQELQACRDRYDEKIKAIDEKHIQEKSQSTLSIERLKQQLQEKKQAVLTLTKESAYFKDKYEKANDQLIKSLRNHAQEIREIKEIHQKEFSKERQKRQKDLAKEKQKHKKELAKEREKKDKESEHIREKEIVYVEKADPRKEEPSIADESRIQVKQNPKIHIQSQLQFQQCNSAQQEPLEERIIHQTRSVEKQSIKNSRSKQIKKKPSDSLSQEHPKRNYMLQPKSSVKSKSKQQSNKSRKLSHDRVPSNDREQSKSRSKSRQYERPIINYDNEHSFILKSCEPVTQQDNIQMYSRQPYYNHHSANNPTRNSATYYWEPNEIAQFGLSQRGNLSTNSYTVEKAMLVEINKETIRLIEQQERCIGLLNENINPNERAENLGRMKQISDQIKLNNEKMLQLKSKIALQ